MELNQLTLIKCNSKDVDKIMDLQEAVFDELSGNVALLRKNERATFESCVASPSLTIGIFDGPELVGVAITAITEGTSDDLVPEMKTPGITRSAYTKLIMIRKRYYGNGIQRAMTWIMEKLAYKAGYEYLLATVSPQNTHSRKNLIDCGYIYDHSAVKYGGFERDVLYKKISVEGYALAINRVADEFALAPTDTCPLFSPDFLSGCFKGFPDLCSVGDVLLLKDSNGNTAYGLYTQNCPLNMLLYSPGEGKAIYISEEAVFKEYFVKDVFINPNKELF